MGYVCVDRGSRRCPCHLMEAGQCYTCTMTRTGVCSCEDAAGWQGVCPYAEYMQQGETPVCGEMECLSEFDVLNKIHYGGGLFVVRLSVPAGVAEDCLHPGAFLMAEALGCRTPFSVLRAQRQGRRGFVELAVKAVGPKSSALTGSGGQEKWKAAGPYYNGLLRGESLPARPGRRLPVIARGMAAVPFLAARQLPELQEMQAALYLDDESLPEPFLEEYLCGQPFERIRLDDEKVREEMKAVLAAAVHPEENEEELRKEEPRAMLLVSPYYESLLTGALTAEEKERLIVPNQANLCCAAGLCGSCSHTGRDGMTIRLCKCSREVLE